MSTSNLTTEKKRFMSTIPGQMMDEHEEINIPLLMISLFSATLAFLLSLSWAAFLGDSVEAVQKATNNRLPMPIARLFAAIVVTVVAITLLIILFHWERRVTQETADTTPNP